ncbi:MAG: TlpA family protein disulfide reductase [Pseudomonadota bacterium]|nr:TlpA family protein disulfide reductase [Pseudomonadota bacterium]
MRSIRTDRLLCIAGISLVVLSGMWAGLWVYSGHGSDHRSAHGPDRGRAGPAVAGVRVPAGEASPVTPSDIAELAAPGEAPLPPPAKIPQRLPDFSLADTAGNPTPISKWHDKSLILNFWATWCAPCRREIPLLQSLLREWGARDVEVVGVAVDHRDQVLAYADEFKVTYPLLVGEQDALDVAAAFGMESPVFPFTVFTDRRGDVVTLYIGELHQAQANLILSVVQQLNQDQLPLAQARHSIEEGLRSLAGHPATDTAGGDAGQPAPKHPG